MAAEWYVHQGVWVLTYNTESTVDGFVSLTGGARVREGRGTGGRGKEDTTRWRGVESGAGGGWEGERAAGRVGGRGDPEP